MPSAQQTNLFETAGPRYARPSRLARLTAPLRPLPNLLVIGAQKAGTTSLHEVLGAHPQIVMSRHKECNGLVGRGMGLLDYRAFFPLSLRCTLEGRRWIGESTPYYMFHPEAPARAATLRPGLRAIAVLRDPVERAWSHHRHNIRRGIDGLGFEQALDAEAERIAVGPSEVPLSGRDCPFRHFSYAARGMYAVQLGRWFGALGRERVLVLDFAALVGDTARTAARIEEFLGVRAGGIMEAARRLPRLNSGGDAAPVPEAARARLEALYAQPDEDLWKLLGERFSWAR